MVSHAIGIQVGTDTAVGIKQPAITPIPDEGELFQALSLIETFSILFFLCFHPTENHIYFSRGCQIMNRYLSQTFHEFPNVLDPQRILQLEKHMRSLECFCLQG